MRVCLVSGEFPPMQGGVGDYTKELGMVLASQGVEVSVLTSAKAAGAECAPLRVFPIVEKWGWGMWSLVQDFLRREHPDVLHIQYQAAAYGMHPAINFLPRRLRLRRERPRVITTFHDLKVPYLFPKAGPLRRWVVLTLASTSDAVVATNIEDFLVLRQKVAGERSRLLSLGVPHPFLQLIPIGSNIIPNPPRGYDRDAWRTRWGVKPDEILLSYFGFLNESKGGETLIRALELLVLWGYPAKLMMVGGRVGSSDPTNLAYLHRMEDLIEQLGLNERVLWTEYTPAEEVSANLLASDICVLPYRDGASFRRGSLQACLAHGLPVVSTYPRVPIPELVDGENIALVPPEDAESLARRIVELIASPQARQRLSQGAMELSRRFGWEDIGRKHLGLYRKVLRMNQRQGGER